MSKLERSNRRPKNVQPVWLVICEGKEKEYFDNLKCIFRVAVDVKPVNYGGGPRYIDDSLFEGVKKLIEDARVGSTAGDGEVNKIFLVWDMDRVSSKKVSKADIQTAIDRFESIQVESILSNPAFEIWILWHLVEYNAKINTEEVTSILARQLGKTGHIKAHQVPWKMLESRIDTANTRAKAKDNPQKKIAEKPNPISRMHLFVDLIKAQ